MGVIIPIAGYHIIEKVVDKSYVVKKAIELGLNVSRTIFLHNPPDVKALVDELGYHSF